MKVGGRVIQNKNISVNTETEFSATYKNHYIEIKLYKRERGENPEWNIDVWHFDGGTAVESIERRCTIHDALIYALNGAML